MRCMDGRFASDDDELLAAQVGMVLSKENDQTPPMEKESPEFADLFDALRARPLRARNYCRRTSS